MADGLQFRIGVPENHDAVVRFLLDYFLPREPTCTALKIEERDIKQAFEVVVDQSLRDSVSILVFNNQNEIIGCRLSCLSREGDDDVLLSAYNSNEKTRLLFLPFLGQLKHFIYDYLERNPGVQTVFKFFAACVRPDYYRRGIAEKMMEMSIKIAREHGCHAIVVLAIAYNSQQLFRKLQFENLGTVMHKDYLDDQGKRIIQCTDQTDCAIVFMKLL